LQLIDDQTGRTLVAVSDDDKEISAGQPKLEERLARGALPDAGLDAKTVKGRSRGRLHAERAGALLAKKALEKQVEKAVFDRGGYKYHGLVKAVAEGARQGGLQF